MFVIILLGAIFLRFYDLGSQSYWMDEGYTVNAILSISEHGNSILDSGQDYFCPLYCYPTAYIAGIFGQNSITYRFFSAIFGSLLVLAIYLMMKRMFARHTALLASFFVAFSYWQIAWSRQARWYTMLTLLFWLAIYCFYQFLRSESGKKRVVYFFSAATVSALAVLTHRIAYLLAPIFLILFIIKAYSERSRMKISKKSVIIGTLLVISAVFIPELILDFGITKALISKIGVYYELPYYLSFFLVNYWLFILLSFYAYFEAPESQKIKYIALGLPFVVYLLAFSFFTNIVHYRYLLAPVLGLYLLGSAGAVDIFRKIWQKYKVMAVLFMTAVIALFFISGQGVWRPLPFYALESDTSLRSLGDRPYWGYTPQPNFNGAYQIIADNLKPEEIVISSHPQFNKIFLRQPGYWIRYDYLGFENRVKIVDNNDREYYAGAKVIDDLAELKQLVSSTHGYIVFDWMSITGRIDPEIIGYIRSAFKQAYFNEVNKYSKIWVYRF